MTEPSLSFGAEAAAYQRGRPDYPATAVAWLLDAVVDGARGVRAADVGAGTGKLTAALLDLGVVVCAVDPDPLMLAELTRRLPDVEARVGTAEDLPFADAAVDAVLFGQSWHWVDVAGASAEVARVLRPGGALGLVWNVRDERAPWVAELSRVMAGSAAERLIASGGPRTTLGPLEHLEVEWEHRATVEDVVAMAASRSSVITAEPEARSTVLRDVRALAEEAAVDGVVLVPYRTHAYRLRP